MSRKRAERVEREMRYSHYTVSGIDPYHTALIPLKKKQQRLQNILGLARTCDAPTLTLDGDDVSVLTFEDKFYVPEQQIPLDALRAMK